MDCHAQPAVARTARAALRAGTAFTGLVLALASGCAGVDQLIAANHAAEKPATPVARVVAMWNNQVITGVDPAHGAAPMYGLAGRVYLYPVDFKENLTADGKLVVELYAVPPEQPQAPPVKMESWELKKDILNSINRRTDGVGEGYSLSLPWPSYRPEIAQVQMRVIYVPEKGLPVIDQSPVALNSGLVGSPVVTNRMETGNRQPVTAAAPPGPPPRSGVPPPGSAVLPAGGAPLPGGLQPAGGAQLQPPGGVQPAAGTQQPVGVTPPAGQYAPACVIQPAGELPPPAPPPAAFPQQGQGAYQAPPPGAFPPLPAPPAPYQAPQPTGGFPR